MYVEIKFSFRLIIENSISFILLRNNLNEILFSIIGLDIKLIMFLIILMHNLSTPYLRA